MPSPLGLIPLKFRRDFWNQKTRFPGLSYGVFYVILGLAIFVELRRVTGGQIERQTHDDSIYHASIASRVKTLSENLLCAIDGRAQ